MVNNLDKYKRAKYLVKELETVLSLINKAYEDLKPYKLFNPVVQSLNALGDSRSIVQIHLRKERRVLESKGKEE